MKGYIFAAVCFFAIFVMELIVVETYGPVMDIPPCGLQAFAIVLSGAALWPLRRLELIFWLAAVLVTVVGGIVNLAAAFQKKTARQNGPGWGAFHKLGTSGSKER